MALIVDILYLLGLVLLSPVWVFRLLVTGKWRTDWRGRFGRCIFPPDSVTPARPVLLIHAVSVGEVNLIRQLVESFAARTDNTWRIVISTTTDTGTERAKKLFEPSFAVVRYPLDFSWCVRRFLNTVRPGMVALAELEVWPNFVGACKRRGVPVCVINGRLSARSYSRYRWIKPLVRPTFRRLAAAAAQTADYAERLIAMGVPREKVHVLDTMKWDTAQIADPRSVPGADELARAMGIDRSGKRPIVVAGSTAPGEDKLLIDTCPHDAQLIIVPRKPEWFDLVEKTAPGIVRRTKHPDGTTRAVDQQRLFLLDTIGELRKAYALADVAVVGRSFLGLHGSDMMEPIALGKPTMVGPYHSDFADTVNALRSAGGLEVTDKPGQLVAQLLADRERARLLAERGKAVILSRQGATERHVDLLLSLAPSPSGRGLG